MPVSRRSLAARPRSLPCEGDCEVGGDVHRHRQVLPVLATGIERPDHRTTHRIEQAHPVTSGEEAGNADAERQAGVSPMFWATSHPIASAASTVFAGSSMVPSS